MSTDFKYSRAIICGGVPASLPTNAQRMNQGEAIDLEKARKDQSDYIDKLKSLGIQVIEIQPDNALPDCVFVEDTAVCLDNTALVCNLGHDSRKPEAARMRKTLEDLGFDIVDMQEPAILDGGDVLFTGKEFFVGVSTRSNEESAAFVAKAFPSFPVATVKVDGHLHLKSMMTMTGPDTIVTGKSKMATGAWKELESKAKFKYNRVIVPEDRAANCLYLNGTLIHIPPHEMPKSIEIYRKMPGPKAKTELGNSEFSKADGCLTCRSILLK